MILGLLYLPPTRYLLLPTQKKENGLVYFCLTGLATVKQSLKCPHRFFSWQVWSMIADLIRNCSSPVFDQSVSNGSSQIPQLKEMNYYWNSFMWYQFTSYHFYTNQTFFQILALISAIFAAVGVVRIIISRIFSYRLMPRAWFDPTSVELHQTETFEGRSTD